MMSFKHTPVFLFFMVTVFLFSCQQEDKLPLDCQRIEKYPCLLSYKTDSLRSLLLAKAKKPLTKAEKQLCFNKDAFDNTDRTKELLYEGKYNVFPIHKIAYSKSILGIYLIKEISEESQFENDILSLVIYNSEGKQADILNINLLNSFGSKEINMISPDEFEILWIDTEYSPDPQSEARDIKNGHEPAPSLITTVYKIDTVGLKFIEQKSWQEN